MARANAFLLTTLVLAAALAGCAGGPAAPDANATTTPTGGTTPTASTPAGTTPAATTPTGATPGGNGSTSDPVRWYAFAFDREVTAASGGSGKIQSFSFTSTREENGQETVIDVDVTVEGVGDEPIQTDKLDLASGTFESETVTSTLRIATLRHELTVVKDDTGERAAGDTSTVTLYVPTEELPEASTVFWYFVKMAWQDEGGESGGWEYYLTPEMAAEMDAGDVIYTPHTEGGATDWWAFDILTATYGLSMFSPFVTGEEGFEEGSFSFGGYSQDVRRERLTVGGYAFDGWSVDISGASQGSSGGWMLKASGDLPIPVSFRFGSSQQGGASSVFSFELTDLSLG